MGNLSLETMENIMNITVYVFVFLFGITIGSFLNVCILRLPRGESLVKRNSHCMTCGTPIKWYDLIPVFSWLILRGKCRACGSKISPRYMLVGSLTGIMFVGIFLRYNFFDYGLYPVMLCLFMAGLIVLCFQDIDDREMCVSVLIYTFIIGKFFVETYTPSNEEKQAIITLTEKAFELTPSKSTVSYLAAAYARSGDYKKAYETLAILPFQGEPTLSNAVYGLLNLPRKR